VLNYYLRRVAASLSQRRRCCGARRLCVRVSVRRAATARRSAQRDCTRRYPPSRDFRRVALVSPAKVMRSIQCSLVSSLQLGTVTLAGWRVVSVARQYVRQYVRGGFLLRTCGAQLRTRPRVPSFQLGTVTLAGGKSCRVARLYVRAINRSAPGFPNALVFCCVRAGPSFGPPRTRPRVLINSLCSSHQSICHSTQQTF